MSEKQDKVNAPFRDQRVNFARRILVWACVTIAIITSMLTMLLVFAVSSDPADIVPVAVAATVLLAFPLLLRLGVSFFLVRFLFFAWVLFAIFYLAISTETGVVLGVLAYLPIFICLAAMIYNTGGVLVITGVSLAIVGVATYYNATILPMTLSFEGVPDILVLTVRHVVGIVLSAVLVIVAMGIFRDLLSRLRNARDKETAASAATSQFLASMSHEVRTPLNAIIGMAEILRTRDLPADEKRQVETIAEAGQALMEMLNQVLDAARLEADSVAFAPEPTEMAEFFESALRLWSPVAEQKGLTFRIGVDPDMPDILELDARRLRQCVNNMLSNAVKFTDEGFAHLTARVDVHDGSPNRLVVEVIDTGIGMSGDAAMRVFAPFEQASETIKRSYGGSGLGLSITRNLARVMGGDLTFKSVQGEGTIFTLTVLATEVAPDVDDLDADAQSTVDGDLPYVLPRTDGEALPGYTEPVVPMPGSTAPPPRVIVADDIATNRFVAAGYLRALGVEAIEQENGADAVRMAREDPNIDLILLDRHMPDTDGIWALKQLKSHPATRHIPVAIFTAGLSEQDRRHYLSLGAVDVLVKPFTIAHLRDLLQSLEMDPTDACATNDS